MASLAAFVASAATISVFLGFAKCIYNLLFHPLRYYPGPLLARATRIYFIFWDLKGVTHKKLNELHAQYGEVVRIAPNELSYNSAQAWRDICGHRTRNRPGSFEKDMTFFNPLGNGSPHIIVANDDDHRRMRRLQSHAFSEKALKAQESVITQYVDLLIKQLLGRAHPQDDGVVDLVRWYNFTTFDIIGDLAFGEPFGCLRDATWHRWIDVLFSVLKSGNYMRAARRFPSPIKETFLFFAPKKLIQDRKYQYEFTSARIEKRLQEGSARPDFMSYILRENNEKGMTVNELKVGAQILIIAGSETTATLLSGATYLLLQNEKVFERLKQEIRSTFENEQDISMQSTAGMPYLNAVLQESLRMYPPVPNAFPRTTPAPGEVVCGKFVPAGTSVGVHHWSSYRSERNFLEPNRFAPERWLGDERFEHDSKDVLQPFSFGPRNCLGRNLALAEMRIILCRMLWNFDLTLQRDSTNWIDNQKTFTLWEKGPLNVKLSSVKRR